MRTPAWLAAALLAAPSLAAAQTWQVIPRITLTETYTDEVDPQDTVRSGPRWITSLAPEVNIAHKGPRLQLSTDYRYRRDFYRDQEEESGRHVLQSAATYEAIEKRFWLEAGASITQERRSAFDAAVVEGEPGPNSNRVETRLASFGPRLRGELGEAAEYAARLRVSSLRSEEIARLDTGEFVATLRSPPRATRLGWAVDASALRTRSDSFGTLDDARARASVIFAVTPQLHVSIAEGVEKTDFSAEQGNRRSGAGAGIQWSPDPRTQLAAVAQRRFFGTGHLATFAHRTPQTAISLSSRRDATVLSSVLGAGGVTLDTLMSDLLASSFPDPAARAQAVRSRLAAFGAAPTTVRGGFVTERPFVNESFEGTVAIIGARNTLTLGFARREFTALLGAPAVADSFAQSEVIRNREFSLGWSHRLTRLTNLTFASTRLRSSGEGPAAPTTSQELDTLFLSTQLGPRTTASLGVRRTDFVSSLGFTNQERAVFGSLSYRL